MKKINQNEKHHFVFTFLRKRTAPKIWLLTLVTSVMQIQKPFFSYEKKEWSFFVILYPERKRRTAHAYTEI